jgi:hypothetical protein
MGCQGENRMIIECGKTGDHALNERKDAVEKKRRDLPFTY